MFFEVNTNTNSNTCRISFSIPIPIPILGNLGFSIPIPIPILAKTPIPQYQYQVLSVSDPSISNPVLIRDNKRTSNEI